MLSAPLRFLDRLATDMSVRGTIREPAASARPPILLGDVLVGCGGRSLRGLSNAAAVAALKGAPDPKRLRFRRDPRGEAASAQPASPNRAAVGAALAKPSPFARPAMARSADPEQRQRVALTHKHARDDEAARVAKQLRRFYARHNPARQTLSAEHFSQIGAESGHSPAQTFSSLRP